MRKLLDIKYAGYVGQEFIPTLDEKDLGDGVFVRAQVRRW